MTLYSSFSTSPTAHLLQEIELLQRLKDVFGRLCSLALGKGLAFRGL